MKITPNRPDCLSVIGLAREVAATYRTPLTAPRTGWYRAAPTAC